MTKSSRPGGRTLSIDPPKAGKYALVKLIVLFSTGKQYFRITMDCLQNIHISAGIMPNVQKNTIFV